MIKQIITTIRSANVNSLELLMPWFVSNGFFLLFWIFTLVAFVWRQRQVRKAYLVFFFLSMLAVGLVIQSPVWPFHNWDLWNRTLPRNVEYFEVWVEDESGSQFVYDLRAVPPLNPAYLNKLYTPRILASAKDGRPDATAGWLLEKINAYDPSPSFGSKLLFPERELSHYQCAGLYEGQHIIPEWPARHGRFVNLVIKKKRAIFGEGPGCAGEFSILQETSVR